MIFCDDIDQQKEATKLPKMVEIEKVIKEMNATIAIFTREGDKDIDHHE